MAAALAVDRSHWPQGRRGGGGCCSWCGGRPVIFHLRSEEGGILACSSQPFGAGAGRPRLGLRILVGMDALARGNPLTGGGGHDEDDVLRRSPS
jgi:hypothetical protein